MTSANELLKRIYSFLSFLFLSFCLQAQTDTTVSKLTFNGDFRFRVEQDWNSRRSSGTFRTDRSRLRYRLRAGFDYQHDSWAWVGVRLRTGDPKKQQDPQLTLGDGFNEFGTLPIALEKAYLKMKSNDFEVWLGKNTFSFKKQNELFWSDNVYPEGIHIRRTFRLGSGPVSQLTINGGHFILNARGGAFGKDSHLQGIQLVAQSFQNRLQFWPSLYLFRNIQNMPDGAGTYSLDYSILGMGASMDLSRSPLIKAELDWYQNTQNYQVNDSIENSMQDQKRGLVLALSYGQLRSAGDWFFKFTYARLEKYAALDIMAQNDWARWDYSGNDSPDGRLTNFEGVELTTAFSIKKDISLKMKYYFVRQLVPLGAFKEDGQRIRFDIDIKF